MTTSPSIQHWLVGVARTAGLPGADDLEVDSNLAIRDAWNEVVRQTDVDPTLLAGEVARHFRLDTADLGRADPTATRLVPASIARRFQFLPLRYSDRTIAVATADPVSLELEREISRVTSRSVVFEVAPPATVAEAVTKAYPEKSEKAHRIPSVHDASGGTRVLVVDDDADTRLLLRSALEDKGFTVTEATDGGEALEQLEQGRVDLVTLDLRMEGLDGLEVLKRIRGDRRTAALPVVVATGADDPEVEMELLEAGADDFVVKPVDPPRFLLRVQAVLRRYGGST